MSQRTPEVIEQKINYLHYNPVRAGYVREPKDWLYSSAADYWGGKGLSEVKQYFSPIFRTWVWTTRCVRDAGHLARDGVSRQRPLLASQLASI